MIRDNRVVGDVGVRPILIPLFEWISTSHLHFLLLALMVRCAAFCVNFFLDRLLDVFFYNLFLVLQLAVERLVSYSEVVLSILGGRFKRRGVSRVRSAQAWIILVNCVEARLCGRRQILRVVTILTLPSG